MIVKVHDLIARFADLFGHRRPPEPVLALSIRRGVAAISWRLASCSLQARVPVALS
jgi:hypothetical protein